MNLSFSHNYSVFLHGEYDLMRIYVSFQNYYRLSWYRDCIRVRSKPEAHILAIKQRAGISKLSLLSVALRLPVGLCSISPDNFSHNCRLVMVFFC